VEDLLAKPKEVVCQKRKRNSAYTRGGRIWKISNKLYGRRRGISPPNPKKLTTGEQNNKNSLDKKKIVSIEGVKRRRRAIRNLPKRTHGGKETRTIRKKGGSYSVGKINEWRKKFEKKKYPCGERGQTWCLVWGPRAIRRGL